MVAMRYELLRIVPGLREVKTIPCCPYFRASAFEKRMLHCVILTNLHWGHVIEMEGLIISLLPLTGQRESASGNSSSLAFHREASHT